MPPRHFSRYLFVGAVFLLGVIVFSTTSHTSAAAAAHDGIRGSIPKITVPGFRFSFQSSAHKPPEQKNSTHGDSDSSWYSDWKWLNPFSSSVTLDEDRVVLPPVADRPAVYTFYDTTFKRDEDTQKVDQELLLTWRRAWWAHGFRPVILTEAEAMSHPLYQTLQEKGMPTALEQEFRQWLAWAHMGTGLLSSWFCLPMGAYDDLLLAHLRRGQYPHLTKFEGLGSGLFAGERTQINDAIQSALGNIKLSTFKSITDAIDSERFKVEQPTSVAHYDSQTITSKYPVLAELIVQDPHKGRLALNQLMITHLHTIWQNSFSTGIAVLQPLPAHTFSLVKPAKDLAHLLAECPSSILQSSCPPNRPKCSPCVGSRLSINTASSFRNTSSLFTIAVVPHPYTMITLANRSDTITVNHIRRRTPRDPWVTAVTRNLLGDARGGPSRVVALKDAVASEYGSFRSLWFTTEHFPATFWPPPPPPKSPTNDAHPVEEKVSPFPEDWLENLDWHFGFPVPRTGISHGESLPPVPGPERWAKLPAGLPADLKKSSDPDPPTAEQAAVEVELLRKARETINSKDAAVVRLRGVAEAWNLADTEAWKFVKSFRARQVVERLQFEEEESAYGTGGGVRGKPRWWGS
ncbi:hypothetical protein A1O3_02451 [Capronia epimyces CBS 606.96]|uniref:Uncharacterized protein n=1 Tax=Capronia epimyces CBS 606.96 TaxID=1182542 RepID=W9Z4H4_9EURO|nr:uncharacterized protein A1O3_02451 [Capronia epimyces CBS 606.96]EXJ89384.1 hypothetical protein A1O3_02451 [Capronia epimyces CBS 606.96]